jgi:hypothetical protein
MLRATNHAGRVLQFATATANLASQNAFLFLATHGPIFIAPSSGSSQRPQASTLIQCGFQYRRWNCSPIPPLVVKTIGTRSIRCCWRRSLYLLVFVSYAGLVPAFGLTRSKDSAHWHAPALEWLTAVGFTMLTSKASLCSQEGLPQTCPSVCLLLPSAEVPKFEVQVAAY